MDTKNTIIQNFAQCINVTANDIYNTTAMLKDNEEENAALVSSLNVWLETMRSNVVLLQQALDKYK